MSTKEGWDWAGRAYHYYVDGRSLCKNWGLPDYEVISSDTGNTEPQRGDCKICLRKLILRRTKLGVSKIVNVDNKNV
jgi:hypothetical protein